MFYSGCVISQGVGAGEEGFVSGCRMEIEAIQRKQIVNNSGDLSLNLKKQK